METVTTPPGRSAELSVGRRYAMVVEISRAIQPGKTRLPKGTVGPLAERYRRCWPRIPHNTMENTAKHR